MASDSTVEATAKYRIGTVTKLTGLSADVVRVWERRYGAIQPVRSGGGSRLYSDAEISRLRRLRQAIEKGHSIGQVARLSEEELDRLLSNDPFPTTEAGDPYSIVRARFLSAIEVLDVVAADMELSRAATLFPARPLIKNVIVPVLDEIGSRWAHKEFGVAQEHVATGLLRNLLSSLFKLYPPTEAAETLVLATLSGERHEFGLLLAALLAATRGWRVIYLGADLPSVEIAFAVELSKSRFLALSLINSEDIKVRSQMETLAERLPLGTRVWVGGSQVDEYSDTIERLSWSLVPDLDDFDNLLRS